MHTQPLPAKSQDVAKGGRRRGNFLFPEERKNSRQIGVSAMALGLLAVLALQLWWGSRHDSATYDEQFHITRGLTFLREGDLRMIIEHPPLIDILIALPLAFDSTITLPLNGPEWMNADKHAFSDLLLWKSNRNGAAIVSKSRVPVIFMCLALGLLIYQWGRELVGAMGSLIGLALFSFDPNVIANGHVATNDMGVTLTTVLSVYLFGKFLQRPGLPRALLSGGALGVALGSKFSSLYLIPVFLIILILELYSRSRRTAPQGRIVRYLIPMLAIAGVTLWATYGFQVGHVRGLPTLCPSYLRGLRTLQDKIDGGTPSFLLGSISAGGTWLYFPIALLVKTPIPTLVLSAAGLAVFARGFKAKRLAGATLLIPPTVYLALCISTNLNIGYRHLLPALPFVFILAAHVFLKCRSSIWWQSAVFILICWLVIGTLRVSPHYFSYFNEIAGGPEGGIRFLSDSNLDWGQDLPGLRKYMDENGITSVKLSYFGTADPVAYGVTCERLPGFPLPKVRADVPLPPLDTSTPGVYAISASNLQGLRLSDHDYYSWFRGRTPDAVIGQSIYVYRIH